MATTFLRQRNANLPIHFFKIILETNVERLKIPNKFTKRHEGGLSNPVSIKPPDGTEWEVYWTKQNGEVWLEKGWKEFAENYSLNHGHLVLFKYEGSSQFDVLILDQSAVEIYYPSSDIRVDHQSDDESVRILEGIPPNLKEHNVMMQLGKRSWSVKLVCCPTMTYDRLTSGWSLFVTESKLQPGHFCVFELIDRQVPVLKVHVFDS